MPTAAGTFEIDLAPQADETPIGRQTLSKRFTGGLVGTSSGQMLAVNHASGAAAYVAMEEVTGRLGGHDGSFVLVHRGFMTSEGATLEVSVAPGTGTGALHGLRGRMTIDRTDAGHTYTFEWSLE